MVFFTICAATYVVNAADRVIFPVLLRVLNLEYHFTLPQGGLLATIFLLGLGLGGIGTGYLVDRLSRKSAMIIGIVIYSVFTLFTAFAFGFFDMAIYRTMTGVGEGMQNVALVTAVGAYYPDTRTLALGLVQCALGLGSFLGPRVGAWLMASTGDWRLPFYLFGVIGLAGAVAVLFVKKGFTEQRAGKVSASGKATGDDHMPESLWNRNVSCIIVTGIFRSFPFYAFLGLYTTFLTSELHYSLAAAAAALSMFGLGPFLSPVAGYVADRVNQKLFQIVMFVAMAVIGYAIFNIAKTPLEHSVLSLLEGVTGGFAYINGYSLAQRSVRSSMIGRVSGFYYASTTLPAAVSGYILAKLVGYFGWSHGATILMSLLLVIPIAVSLFIDTSLITGPGRRLSPGRSFWA
jgi:MFS family permease